jgi:hypothetical protein
MPKIESQYTTFLPPDEKRKPTFESSPDLRIQRFLTAGLIQRLTITRIPVLLGGGIPLFGQLEADIHLHHVATRQYSSGMVQSEYVVST